MAYSTGNPPGSTDPRDMFDNAHTFDNLIAGDQPFYPDRLDKQRLSWSGMEYNFEVAQTGRTAAFNAQMASLGYISKGAYAVGVVLEAYNEYVAVPGIVSGGTPAFFRPGPGAVLPLTLEGTWALDAPNLLQMDNDDVLRQELASPDGSSLVGLPGGGTVEDIVSEGPSAGAALVPYQTGETGSSPRSTADKLSDIPSRADYSSDADFNAAKVGKPNIDGAGTFDAPVKPAGEATQIPLASALMPVVGQQRAKINYYSGQVVEAWLPNDLVMAGFRFAGSYKKGRAPLFSSGVNGKALVSLVDDLGAESVVQPDNWYAVFACANDGDATVTYKLMPFLRVGSVTGSVCTLNYAGMGANAHSVVAATYDWGVDSLAGVDCLVVNEGNENRFSGRVTKISANNATTVTLEAIGSVGAYDFLLPSPSGFDHYVYLGSFYRDQAEVMNIADSGSSVMFYGVVLSDPNWPAAGAVAAPGVKLTVGGYIPPLAMGVTVTDVETIGTATVSGSLTTLFSHDGSNHTIAQHFITKANAANVTGVQRFDLMFSKAQFFLFYTGGNLQASRASASLQIRGWIEP